MFLGSLFHEPPRRTRRFWWIPKLNKISKKLKQVKKMNNQLPKIVQDCHNLLLWLIPILDKFPRSRRFTIGERLENGALNLLTDLIEATYSKQKKTALTRANRQLEIIRHLWRLAYELKVIPQHRYQHGAKLINEIGRQLGGWLRG
jgi:hypothetical protein